MSFNVSYSISNQLEMRKTDKDNEFTWTVFIGVQFQEYPTLILNSLGGSIVFLYSGNDADLTLSCNHYSCTNC